MNRKILTYGGYFETFMKTLAPKAQEKIKYGLGTGGQELVPLFRWEAALAAERVISWVKPKNEIIL